MNMVISGDGHTNISQVDSLKHPVKEEYNVVLTNYAFSQKTDYSGYYGLETEDANPVFLKHAIDALVKGGRGGVVVPDGLLFDTTSQYMKIRKILLEQCNLIAVIKLHEFTFRPYTGQPTSILIFEKGPSTKNVWFFEVKEDGFKKTGSKMGRPPIWENDLILLRQLWAEKADSEQSFSINMDIIKEHQYKLAINEYREKFGENTWVPLGGAEGLCNIRIGGTPSTKNPKYWGGNHPWVTITDMTQSVITDTNRKITDLGVNHCSVKLLQKGTVLLSFKLSIGKVAIAGTPLYTNEAIAGIIPKDETKVLPKYLFYILPRLNYSSYMQPAAKGKTLNKSILEKIKIPLPTISTQQKLIATMDEKETQKQELSKTIDSITQEQITVVSRQVV